MLVALVTRRAVIQRRALGGAPRTDQISGGGSRAAHRLPTAFVCTDRGGLAPCLQVGHEHLGHGHASAELQECREHLQLVQERAAVASSNTDGGCALQGEMHSETRLRIAELAEENEALQTR